MKMKKRSYKILALALSIALLMTVTVFAGTDHKGNTYEAYAKQLISVKGDGVSKEMTYTVGDLEKMTDGLVEGNYTMRTLVEPHTDQYEGVSLPYLLQKAGVKKEASSVQIVCGDGASMNFTMEEILKEDYINEADTGKLKVILAFGKNKTPLVPDKASAGYVASVGNDGGPLRLMVGQTAKGERNSPKCLQNVSSIVVSTKSVGTQFTDIGNFYGWTSEAIYSLVEKGVLSGVGDGKFAPEKNVTRAEFSKMLVLSKGLTPVETPTGLFTDVPKTAWYAPYVEAAVKAGLLEGVGNNQFNPNANINRNEVAVLSVRAMGKEAEAKAFNGTMTAYKDVAKIPQWAKGSVQVATDKKIFDNIAVSYFNGRALINRAEAAVIIDRIIK
ncbi:MAG: S-layer homology domain-containing protein [Anaerovorax sp.]